MKRALIVEYDPPPIPGWRGLAYVALLDGYDAGDPVGRGPTRRAAVRELAEARHWLGERHADSLRGVRMELARMRGVRV